MREKTCGLQSYFHVPKQRRVKHLKAAKNTRSSLRKVLLKKTQRSKTWFKKKKRRFSVLSSPRAHLGDK